MGPTEAEELVQKVLPPTEEELMQQEEKCRKARKTITKAIAIRLFVTVLLIWILFQTAMELWVIGLMVFVMLINLSGMLPLVAELKKQNCRLREIMDQYE